MAISRQVWMIVGSTERVKSRRFRTVRVVVSSLSTVARSMERSPLPRWAIIVLGSGYFDKGMATSYTQQGGGTIARRNIDGYRSVDRRNTSQAGRRPIFGRPSTRV